MDCIVSIPFSIHFLRCWQGEFVQWSTALQLVIILTAILVILMIDSGVILLRKISMLVTLRCQRIGHQFSSLHQVLKSNNVLMFIFFVISHHFSTSKCINIEIIGKFNVCSALGWKNCDTNCWSPSLWCWIFKKFDWCYKLITLNIFANSRYSRTCQRLLSNIF